MYLSVIIPSFNGSHVLEKNLPYLLSGLNSINKPYEVIVVDDGSQDGGGTENIAKHFNCLFFRHDKNTGKGAAVKTGMLQARGQFRIFTDVDIPFEFDSILTFLSALEGGECDVVVGDRNHPDSSYFHEVTLTRRIGSILFSGLVSALFFKNISDTQCGLKGFKSAVADELFSLSRINRFSFDVEILYLAILKGYKIRKFPVQLRCQESESVNVVRDGFEMLTSIARVKLRSMLGGY